MSWPMPWRRPTCRLTMLNRGKLAVLTMFAVALVAAAFAWWWNYSRGQKCLAFYGPDAALLVRTVKDVELLELTPDNDRTEDRDVDRIAVGDQTFLVHRNTTISQARGLIHARTSIVDDTSFVWNSRSDVTIKDVRFAVRFWDADRAAKATIVFDFGQDRLWHIEQQKSVQLIPKVAQGWKSFLSRQVGS